MSAAVRKMIYSGSAVADLDGKTVHLSVYHLGGLSYEFTCSNRGKHIYRPRTATDPNMFKAEFAEVYELKQIDLKPILPTRSEGQR